MRTLVTGGAGFIGSHLVDRLIDGGHSVAIVDNFYNGRKSNINRWAQFYDADITDASALERVFDAVKPEIVFHTAAQAFVSVSTKRPQEDARINIIGSLNVLDACRDHGVSKIIYSNSGGASYGNPQYLPIDEKHPINPVSQYGISKHTVEHYLFLYKNNYDLDYTSLGYANIYGPRQDPKGEGGVVAIFMDKMLKGERPIIFGDGSQIRDYCFVKDVVDANVWAMTHGSGERYNVGTGVGIRTQEVFDIIKKVMGSDIVPIYQPERVGDAKACILDSGKLQLGGWKPRYSFEQGVAETAKYFRSLK